MEFRKMVMITLYVRQQKRHRCARSPQGRGEQGPLGAEMARRLPTAASNLRTAHSAMFAQVQRVSARHL